MYLTKPFLRAECDTRSIFKRSLTGLNSDFSFSRTGCSSKVKEPCLFNYSSIAGGRIVGCIPFPRSLARCEIQTASSRFRTRVTISISNDDNHYTMGASIIHSSIISFSLQELQKSSKVRWISRPCSKPNQGSNIQRVSGELITFALYLTLLKYCKTFDSRITLI